eukprot:2556012-Rhodomonas_salina.2
MGCGASSQKSGPESPTKSPHAKDRKKGQKKSVDDSAECRLRVLFVNDVYELDNWPRFLTAVEKLSDSNTIVLLPGDFLAPSLLSSIDQGRGKRIELVSLVRFGNSASLPAHMF